MGPRRTIRPNRWAIAVVLLALLVGAGLAVALTRSSSDAERPARQGVLWAIGDGATSGQPPKQVAALVARDRPERVLYLGDVYESGSPSEFKENFDGVYGPLVKSMLPTPGNHDWPAHAEGYDPYWRKVRGGPLPWWYSRGAGGWTLISLNSEDARDPAQLEWLRRRLRGRNTCRIVFMHRPRFSAGRHGDQADLAPLWDAIEGRAALLLSGHDHDLQRFKPIHGTVQMVSGAAGRDLYAVDASDPRLAFSDDRHFGGLRMYLRPGRADLAFVAADGTVLDRSTVKCRR